MAAALAALPLLTHAQNVFNRAEHGGGIDFSYTYPTPQDQPQTLKFRLNLDDIQRGSAEFTQWNQAEFRQSGLAAAQAAAAKLQTDTLNLQVFNSGNSITTRFSGYGKMPSPAQQDAIEKTISTAYDSGVQSYAHSHLYTVIHKSQTLGLVQPDYVAITKRYTNAMAPIAQAILQQVPETQADQRLFINVALNWLQTIPYDTLQNRATSNGAGFQTPYGLLLGNRGDCDTKTVALAALLHAAYPQIPIAIILIPHHAFLGIGLPQTSKDFALRTEFGTYILAEPTGPALTPLGFIEPSTQQSITANPTDVLPIR